MNDNFVLKGTVCYSRSRTEIAVFPDSYVVCEKGISRGVYQTLPKEYQALPLTDYGDKLILPGLVDPHTHAPQYPFRGTGMDLELVEWLQSRAFPEETR